MHGQTFYSTVLKLQAQGGGSLPATQGRLANGAFLDLIKTVDPALSERIHDEMEQKPFTVSPLAGFRKRGRRLPVRNGEMGQLRFTLLNSTLFTTLTQYLLATKRSQLPTLRLGEIDFAIVEMLTTPGSDPWAGYVTLKGLHQRWYEEPLPKDAPYIALESSSGLAFSRSNDHEAVGKFLVFYPEPSLFFGSLANRWVKLTGHTLSVDNETLRDYVARTVVVREFNMRTKCFFYWGHPLIGGVGRFTYELLDTENESMVRVLNMLADFAFYSGVGSKTAMGLGQVRRQPVR